jgi:hypothetical protein
MIMKKILFFFGLIIVLAGCKNEVVPKPAKLIDEDKMVDIIYDLTILEAIKFQNDSLARTYRINPKQYIYRKYNIDSLQFAKSNHYYASDVGNYKKMYEKVAKRFEDEQKQADAQMKASGAKVPAPTTSEEDRPRIE